MKGDGTTPLDIVTLVAELEQECAETEKGGKGAWQTATEREGRARHWERAGEYGGGNPTMQGQRSKGSKECFLKKAVTQ